MPSHGRCRENDGKWKNIALKRCRFCFNQYFSVYVPVCVSLLLPNSTYFLQTYGILMFQNGNNISLLKTPNPNKTFFVKLVWLYRSLPLTSMMKGFSPGAWLFDMTVSADTWATERTVAADMKGAPIRPQQTLERHTSTISRWNPDPFFSFLSFLSIINLLKVTLTHNTGNQKIMLSSSNYKLQNQWIKNEELIVFWST